MDRRTFIFPDVFQCKRQVGVFALDNADLAEGASADHSQQAEVVEVGCCSVSSAY